MLKIAVFGFFRPDQVRISLPHEREDQLSPVHTQDFMQAIAALAGPGAPTRYRAGAPCFVKLTGVTPQPVYVQALSNEMAPGAGLLNCDGYVPIIDAVKILAPKTIVVALRRLQELHPRAHVILAAGRQNEPEALSSDEIREALGLHRDLPIYPYVPGEPKTAQRLIKRLARYLNDPNRAAAPIFAGTPAPSSARLRVRPATDRERPAAAPSEPHIRGLDHVALATGDLPRALDFYRGLLGFRVVGEVDTGEGVVVTLLDTGRSLLGLYVCTGGTPHAWLPRPGAGHVVLGVTGLEAITDQLTCADVPCLLEPTILAGRTTAAFHDPDGNVVRLVEGEITYTRR